MQLGKDAEGRAGLASRRRGERAALVACCALTLVVQGGCPPVDPCAGVVCGENAVCMHGRCVPRPNDAQSADTGPPWGDGQSWLDDSDVGDVGGDDGAGGVDGPQPNCSWATEDGPDGTLMRDVWAASAVAVAVGAAGKGWRFAAGSWQALPSATPFTLWGVWGSSPSDLFAVGDGGTVLHGDGTSWAEMDSGTTQPLRDVWGAGAQAVFAVGYAGTILEYDGDHWDEMDSNTNFPLRGVWGSGAEDVYAVGDVGTVVRYDGQNGDDWTVLETPTSHVLRGVGGNGAGEVYAVGNAGTVLRWNGQLWAEMNEATPVTLWDVQGLGAGQAMAVGDAGKVVRLAGGAWALEDLGASHGLFGISGAWCHLFIVGGGGKALHHRP